MDTAIDYCKLPGLISLPEEAPEKELDIDEED